MVIQTNILAMNAGRQFGITTLEQKKSSEKLSSGFKINRAADDAAGLTISEKMRRQIRGLNQASDNAQDGISMVQTAEGALNEVHDMLHRMNELCVKAANDTLTYEDRTSIQAEIDELTDEINHVGDGTTFNTIKLFDGLPQTRADAVNPGIKINGNQGTITQAVAEPERDAIYENEPVKPGDMVEIPGSDGRKYYKAATQAEIDEYEKGWKDYEDSLDGPDVLPEPLKRDGSTEDKAVLMTVDKIQRQIMNSLGGTNAAQNAGIVDSVGVSYSSLNPGAFELHFYGPLHVELQIGTEKDHTMSFDIDPINSASLGVHNIDVRDNDGSGARSGIDKVKAAIEKTSAERSELGAVQNRLEHTIRNLDNVAENTTSAESAIRDTDMSSEMVKYSKSNIVAQVGQSMLAQANQSKQGVLNLLG